jgi:hypothetical protein
MLVVDLPTNAHEARVGVMLGLEGEAYADDLEGVGEEDRGDAGEGTADEAAEGCLLRTVPDEDSTDLLISQELDSRVGEDAEQRGRVPSEESAYALLSADIAHSPYYSRPVPRVFRELRIRSLEEDLHAVEGPDEGFRLLCWWSALQLNVGKSHRVGDLTAHPASPPASPVRRT